MAEVIQSSGGVVYYVASDGEPRYLLIKRHALSGKIERVLPKGKIQGKEKTEDAALREVSEESGIPLNLLRIKALLGTAKIRVMEPKTTPFTKDVTYFLMEFLGDPSIVHIQQGEGYLGVYKRAALHDVLGLIYYQDVRELIRKSYLLIQQSQKNLSVKKAFLDRLG